MSVKRIQENKGVVYYCTITCHNWLPLFEETEFYSEIYKWFKILEAQKVLIAGYVIMPNHLHLLLFLAENAQVLNKVIANGKRFMAYEIVKRLKQLNKDDILLVLSNDVPTNEKKKGKLHQIFTPSFDAKPCFTEKFLLQKLNYIHRNPVSGKWKLVQDYRDYLHSSAKFYELNQACLYNVTHYADLG
jgi:REP element-mobilizing transposase RayT